MQIQAHVRRGRCRDQARAQSHRWQYGVQASGIAAIVEVISTGVQGQGGGSLRPMLGVAQGAGP